MRIANHNNRAVLLTSDEAALDIHTASDGRFGPGLPALYNDWEAFTSWAKNVPGSDGDISIDRSYLGSPSPAPRQIFAIGLNYSEHAKESGFAQPDTLPPVFTKFVSALTGPDTTVVLPEGGPLRWPWRSRPHGGGRHRGQPRRRAAGAATRDGRGKHPDYGTRLRTLRCGRILSLMPFALSRVVKSSPLVVWPGFTLVSTSVLFSTRVPLASTASQSHW